MQSEHITITLSRKEGKIKQLQTLWLSSCNWCLSVWLEHILHKWFFDRQKFRKLSFQLGGVKLIVASWCNYHLRLLLKIEVLPCEGWVNVLTVQFQDLVVANTTRVCEVVDPSEVSFRHFYGDWKKFIKDGHGVWDVYHFLIAADLCDKVSGVWKIGRNRHSDTECAYVLIVFEQLLYLRVRQTRR